MKHTGQSIDTVRAHMPTWQNKEHLLVRIGGCYTDTSGPIISINRVAQLWVKRDENDLLLLSFELRNANDEVVVSGRQTAAAVGVPGNYRTFPTARQYRWGGTPLCETLR
jgi:hypothetical protein